LRHAHFEGTSGKPEELQEDALPRTFAPAKSSAQSEKSLFTLNTQYLTKASSQR
jgi:hypothetical protein